MMKDIIELIFIHIVCIVLLGLIIITTMRLKRNNIFYWVIAGLYVLTLIWLIYEYISLGVKPDPGGFFAWEMLAMIIPGILTLIALIVFIVSRIVARKQ
jgi:hypothetical protein